jgi:hypothetical protein
MKIPVSLSYSLAFPSVFQDWLTFFTDLNKDVEYLKEMLYHEQQAHRVFEAKADFGEALAQSKDREAQDKAA